jgi:hypothetical protein
MSDSIDLQVDCEPAIKISVRKGQPLLFTSPFRPVALFTQTVFVQELGPGINPVVTYNPTGAGGQAFSIDLFQPQTALNFCDGPSGPTPIIPRVRPATGPIINPAGFTLHEIQTRGTTSSAPILTNPLYFTTFTVQVPNLVGPLPAVFRHAVPNPPPSPTPNFPALIPVEFNCVSEDICSGSERILAVLFPDNTYAFYVWRQIDPTCPSPGPADDPNPPADLFLQAF